MTGMIQKALVLAKLWNSKVFAVAVLTVALAFTVILFLPGDPTPSPVEDTDLDDSPVTGYFSRTPQIATERAFAVRVVCDGRKDVFMVTGGTITDILEMAGVTLGQYDEVDWPMERVVRENDTITVTRKDIVKRTDEVELPYETVEVPTSLLRAGRQEVLIEGRPGIHRTVYEETIIDGRTTDVELLQDKIVQKPVRATVLVGDPGAPISNLEFDVDLDESGEPMEYIDVLREQRASGYSAPPGARTASGRQADVGHVAVNPRVIPYGTKLYIRSSDGSFVYGYAIAADTGTALMDGRVAVDLYYDTYLESKLNSIRSVDIFILE